MGQEDSTIRIRHLTSVSGRVIAQRDTVFFKGKMVTLTMVNGAISRCRDTVLSDCLMETSLKAISVRI